MHLGLIMYNGSGQTTCLLLTIVKLKDLSVMGKYYNIYICVAVSNMTIFSEYLKAFKRAAHYYELISGCDTIQNL
jgi:hypothetical protein